MHTLFQQAAYQGASSSGGDLVKCDSETTTQNDIDRGVVNILVGFTPLKPAEFVILQIDQLASQVASWLARYLQGRVAPGHDRGRRVPRGR